MGPSVRCSDSEDVADRSPFLLLASCSCVRSWYTVEVLDEKEADKVLEAWLFEVGILEVKGLFLGLVSLALSQL